jgi:hypothetical protein
MFIPQAIEGSNSRIAVQLCLSENIGKYGDVKIDSKHPHHLDLIGGSHLGDDLEQPVGIILAAIRIIKPVDIKAALLQYHRIGKLYGYIFGNFSSQFPLE